MQRQEPLAETAVVLFRKNLCGSHHCPLPSSLDRLEQCSHGDNGFAAPHITLNQPGHGLRSFEIIINLRQHSVLCRCELEGKIVEEATQQTIRIRWKP